MSHNLVLFCGGKNVYYGSKPKPLKLLPNGRSLIYNFLQQATLQSFSKIILLVEEASVSSFIKEVQSSGSHADKVLVLPVSNQSTTLEKLQKFLKTESAQERPFLLSYPDIFYFGDLSKLLEHEGRMSSVRVSGVFLQSRFPVINLNFYTQKARSISLNPSRVPANASVIFGGHISSSAYQLERLLFEFYTDKNYMDKRNLEGEFLKFTANKEMLDVDILAAKWLKSDSINEEIEILDELYGKNELKT